MKAALGEFGKEFAGASGEGSGDAAGRCRRSKRSARASRRSRTRRRSPRAMKLVAAARLRRAQDAIIAARPYAQRLARGDRRGRGAPAPRRRRRGAPAARAPRRSKKVRVIVVIVRPRPGRRLQRQPHPRALERFIVDEKEQVRRRSSWRSSAARAREYFKRRSRSTIAPRVVAESRRRRRTRARARARAGRRRRPSDFLDGKIDAVSSSTTSSRAPSRRWCRSSRCCRSSRRSSPRRRRPHRLRVRAVQKASCSTLLPLYVEIAALPRAARVDRLRVRRAHDRDGQRHQERQGDDRHASRCSTTAPARRRSPRS